MSIIKSMSAMNVKIILTTAEVADRAGLHKDTLLRWLSQEAVRKPKRKRRGWRIFTREEPATIENLAKSETPASETDGKLKPQCSQ
jgi:site-specific DNA-methyltransferase (cytosine-N4-specific)